MATKSKSQSKNDGKAEKLKQKEDTREKYAYKVLPAKNTAILFEITDEDELQLKMSEMMNITKMETDLCDACLLDYYVAAFWWARDQGFSAEQVSAFFTIIHTLIINLKEKSMSQLDNLKELKKMLANCILETTLDESTGCENFNITQGLLITEYLTKSIIQHYKLYEFVFQSSQSMQIIGSTLQLELPPPISLPWPPPLVEGITEEFYNDHFVEKSVEEQEAAANADVATNEQITEEDLQKEADILSRLTAQQVQKVMNEVFTDVLGGLQTEVTEKLRERENSFINRINKLHKIS